MLKKNFAVVCFAILIAPGVSSAQETFRWSFSENDQFNVRIEQTMTVDTAIDRRTVHHENKMALDIEWTVESFDEKNGATINQVIRGVHVQLELPGTDGQENYQFDSSKADETEANSRRLQKSFEAILNQPIKIVMSTTGEISDVDIPKETLESLRNMPGSMQGRELFSPESIRDMFMHAMVPFPEDGVSQGDSWSHDREFKLGPRDFEMNSQYSYDGKDESGRDVVSVASKLTKKSSESANDEFEIAEQESTGKIFFDFDAGHCSGGEVDLSLTTQVPYRDKTVRSTVISRQTITITRK